jgi:hypothetical protein
VNPGVSTDILICAADAVADSGKGVRFAVLAGIIDTSEDHNTELQ